MNRELKNLEEWLKTPNKNSKNKKTQKEKKSSNESRKMQGINHNQFKSPIPISKFN